jgi:transcriptional regulator with XRE-family HTH domain
METEEMEKLKAEFRIWFNRKWAEWDASIDGQHSSQQELADYLCIPRPTIAQYTSGKKMPKGDNLRKIARKFGDDFFKDHKISVPLNPPDEFSQFPNSVASRLRAASEEIEFMLNSGKFLPDSLEHERAAREIFFRYGLDLKDIEIEQ